MSASTLAAQPPAPPQIPPRTAAKDPLALLPVVSKERGYVSSKECQQCHEEEFASWRRTYHRTMTQPALPENVKGAFDGSTIISGGLQYRVLREGDQFFAEMPDPDVMMYIVQGGRKLSFDQAPRVRLPVVLATGSHHYQTYWVASPRYDRLLQTLPLVYLLADKRWVPREAAFMRGPNDTERFVTQWNHHCIRCHSTGGNPGLNEKTGMLETRVGEFGIACEACHGPGEKHVELRRLAAASGAAPLLGQDPIVHPKNLDHRRSSEICGQCHGVYIMRDEFAMQYAREGPLFRPGDDLHKTRYYIQHPEKEPSAERQEELRRNPQFFRERWWDDGTILAGGREYTAMSVSGCYTRGEISCLSCHSMHKSDPDDQLKRFATNNHQCTQCHREEKFNGELARHTFHRPESSGSNCLNCHMPHITYALFKAIRSHQISSPNLAGSIQHGVPNACNLCHLDKTLEWTQRALEERYRIQPRPLSDEQKDIAAAVLWLTKGHAAQRVITAWHFGWAPAQEASGRDWLAPFLATLLEDPYGVVRYVAARSLKTVPGFQELQYDFLAAPAELTKRARGVTQRWQVTRKAQTGSKGAPVLMNEEGDLDQALLEKLLRERDNRPVTIKE